MRPVRVEFQAFGPYARHEKVDFETVSRNGLFLNSIQKANGLVGIISHVQLLQDQIPSKLRVEEDAGGSHIVQTVG